MRDLSLSLFLKFANLNRLINARATSDEFLSLLAYSQNFNFATTTTTTRGRRAISNSRGGESSRVRGTGKNISGVSIVTPRERNDSAFLREKCRPGIFLRSQSVSRAREKGAEEDEERDQRAKKTKAEERNFRDIGRSPRTRNDAKETLGTASHVATVATYSRARTYVFIATGALSAGLERKRKKYANRQREGEREDQMELRVCEDYWRRAC